MIAVRPDYGEAAGSAALSSMVNTRTFADLP
jgi:hypothetical protein